MVLANLISAGFFFTIVRMKRVVVRTNGGDRRGPLSYGVNISMCCSYKIEKTLNISTATLIFLVEFTYFAK